MKKSYGKKLDANGGCFNIAVWVPFTETAVHKNIQFTCPINDLLSFEENTALDFQNLNLVECPVVCAF
jgi:hypothetical protein